MKNDKPECKPENRAGKIPLKRLVMLCCVLVTVVMVIWGMVETYHLTEGEALVKGWKYWGGAISSGALYHFINSKA